MTAASQILSEQIEKVRHLIESADAIVIGAGAGLSAAGGLTYSGNRFADNFQPFIQRYHMTDMYTAGFYPFETLEEKWAYWSRHILLNRYDAPVGQPYADLLAILEGGVDDEADECAAKRTNAKKRNYFIITTNVDQQFVRAGFPKEKVFATQGDYGMFQCEHACHRTLYPNEVIVRLMATHQEDCKLVPLSPAESESLLLEGHFDLDTGAVSPSPYLPVQHSLPSLIPICPKCKGNMTTNLRIDRNFVEDAAWEAGSQRYEDFLKEHFFSVLETVDNTDGDAPPKPRRSILFVELGVGMNTPGIIKVPFMRMVAAAVSAARGTPRRSAHTESSSSSTSVCPLSANLVTMNIESFGIGDPNNKGALGDATIPIVGDIRHSIAQLAARMRAKDLGGIID